MSETVGALCALGSAVAWSVTSLMVRTLAPGIGTFTINKFCILVVRNSPLAKRSASSAAPRS